MDGISWLVKKLGLVSRDAHKQVQFEKIEFQKEVIALRASLYEVRERLDIAQRNASDFEDQLLVENEKSALAVARVSDLESQIEYLRGEVKIYQGRLGLLPQERQSETKTDHKPLRRAREPFPVIQARLQANLNEEYWREKAAAASAELGTTSEDTPTVTEKEN